MITSRAVRVSGVAFAVLFVGAAVTIGNYQFLPPSEEIVAFYGEHSRRVFYGAYLGLLSTVFLLWFSVLLAAVLRSVKGAFGWGALAGGTLAAVMVALAHLAHAVAAERASADGGIGPDAATALFDLSSASLGNGVPLGLAVLIGAAGLAARRAPILPKWLAWASLVTALALVSPLGWLFLAVGLLWVAVAGVLLGRGALEPEAGSSAPV